MEGRGLNCMPPTGCIHGTDKLPKVLPAGRRVLCNQMEFPNGPSVFVLLSHHVLENCVSLYTGYNCLTGRCNPHITPYVVVMNLEVRYILFMPHGSIWQCAFDAVTLSTCTLALTYIIQLKRLDLTRIHTVIMWVW